MRATTPGFFLLAAVLAGSASAQMYKVVGPDGKISYTDRPPVDASARVTVMKGGQAVPLTAASAPGVAASALPAPSAAASAPKDAKAEQAKQTLKALADNPGLVAGIALVLDMSELVNQSAAICARLPAARSYNAAKEAWSLRNAQVLSHHRSVYQALYPGADGDALKKGVADRVAKTLEQVGAANEASRVKWCDKSMEEVRIGKMDLTGKDGVDALMKFRPRGG